MSLLLLGFGLLVSAVWGRRHYQPPQEPENRPLSLFQKHLGGNMKTILVVDDNSTLLHLMSLTLQSMGYKPITAANGNEGVEKAIFDKPDLMLLDVMLPDMDGPQVAKILRHEPTTKDIPIIAISAAFGTSVRRACLTAGCNDFMLKPFTNELLGEKLRSFITIS
jgi:two-component system alkaline phosphatase synthesis response regulator PhoP